MAQKPQTKISVVLDEETADRLDYLAAKLTALGRRSGVDVPIELEQALIRALRCGLDRLDQELHVRSPATPMEPMGEVDALRPSRRGAR